MTVCVKHDGRIAEQRQRKKGRKAYEKSLININIGEKVFVPLRFNRLICSDILPVKRNAKLACGVVSQRSSLFLSHKYRQRRSGISKYLIAWLNITTLHIKFYWDLEILSDI